MVCTLMCDEKRCLSPCSSTAKHHNPSLIMRRTSDTSVRSSLHSPTSTPSRLSRSHQKKESKKLSQPREASQDRTAGYNIVSWMGSGREERTWEQAEEIWFPCFALVIVSQTWLVLDDLDSFEEVFLRRGFVSISLD